MRAINHALTGSLIGLTIGKPAIALPLAVLSHFVCDAIPHYDSAQPNKQWMKSQSFRVLLVIDALLCFSLVLLLAFNHPLNWRLAAVCAFLAAAPDFLWLPRYLRARSGKVWKHSRFSKFASDIQWFARPIGAVVEVAWFIGALALLTPFLVR